MSNRTYTVQCGFADYNACTVVVEADSIEEACEKAVEEAGNDSHWRRIDHCGDTFVDAIAEGEDVDPWVTNGTIGSAIPVPEKFTERAIHVAPKPEPAEHTSLGDVTVEVTAEFLARHAGRDSCDDNAVSAAVLAALRADEAWRARLPDDTVVEVLAQDDDSDGWKINLVTRVPPPWDGWARIFWWPNVEADSDDYAASISAVMYAEDGLKPFSFTLSMDAV